jgi:hypothetical protein
MPEHVRRGRPPKTSGTAKRPQFNARIRPALREALEAAAKENRRSVSEEAEARLEQSLTLERLLGDKASADFALLLGATFILAGRQAVAFDGRPDSTTTEWLKDGWIYEAAAFSVTDVLWQRHPAPGQYWGTFREWVKRIFARGAIRCGKTIAAGDELKIELSRGDLMREGELR